MTDTTGTSSPADNSSAADPSELARSWATARVEGSFRDIYLTLLSIIQGVALAYLLETIGDDYKHLTLDQIGRIVLVFMFIVAVWQEYLIGSIMYAWIPGLTDSAAPFLIGAGEGMMITTIRGSTSEFLFFATCATIAGAIGGLNYARHARAQRMQTTQQSQQVIAAHPALAAGMSVAGSLLLGVLWAYSLTPLRQPHPAVFPWLGSLVFLAFFVSMYWRWTRPMYGPTRTHGGSRRGAGTTASPADGLRPPGAAHASAVRQRRQAAAENDSSTGSRSTDDHGTD